MNHAAKSIETRFLIHQRNNIYIPLEDEEFDWFWDLEDVLEFDELYQQGKSIQEIAEYFGRTHEEVAILVIDRALKNKIRSD
jgi:hypothetical protein